MPSFNEQSTNNNNNSTKKWNFFLLRVCFFPSSFMVFVVSYKRFIWFCWCLSYFPILVVAGCCCQAPLLLPNAIKMFMVRYVCGSNCTIPVHKIVTFLFAMQFLCMRFDHWCLVKAEWANKLLLPRDRKNLFITFFTNIELMNDVKPIKRIVAVYLFFFSFHVTVNLYVKCNGKIAFLPVAAKQKWWM